MEVDYDDVHGEWWCRRIQKLILDIIVNANTIQDMPDFISWTCGLASKIRRSNECQEYFVKRKKLIVELISEGCRQDNTDSAQNERAFDIARAQCEDSLYLGLNDATLTYQLHLATGNLEDLYSTSCYLTKKGRIYSKLQGGERSSIGFRFAVVLEKWSPPREYYQIIFQGVQLQRWIR